MSIRSHWRRLGAAAAGLLVALSTAATQNAADQAGPSSDAGAGAPIASNSPSTLSAQPAIKPGAAAEILKMTDAGVSPEVIKLFIENKPEGFTVTADDLIALKKRGIGDDISTALVRRGTGPVAVPTREPAASAGTPQQMNVAAPPAGAGVVYGGIDPESYDYFRMYYLQPRALAAAYQRLGYYGAPFDYGYGRPWSYGAGLPVGAPPWSYGSRWRGGPYFRP